MFRWYQCMLFDVSNFLPYPPMATMITTVVSTLLPCRSSTGSQSPNYEGVLSSRSAAVVKYIETWLYNSNAICDVIYSNRVM